MRSTMSLLLCRSKILFCQGFPCSVKLKRAETNDQVPFPMNLILSPFTISESLLRWTVLPPPTQSFILLLRARGFFICQCNTRGKITK
jgi:hypothetical protein